jgi:hypothetical protein
MDAKTFYAGKTLSEIEWWISSCCEFPELDWGRLRIFSDGTADAAFDDADVYGFDDRKYAGTSWQRMSILGSRSLMPRTRQTSERRRPSSFRQHGMTRQRAFTILLLTEVPSNKSLDASRDSVFRMKFL